MDQTSEIFVYLKSGKKLTPLEALKKFDCFRLSARIFDIRRNGWPIDRELITTKSGKVVAQYSMPRQKRR